MPFLKWFTVLTCLFFSGCAAIRKDESFRLAAEWEPHEAVWVGVFQQPGRDTVTAQIIKAIYQNVQVKLNYSKEATRIRYNPFYASLGIDTLKLNWIQDSVNMPWIRDPGPLFLVNKNGEQKVLDFNWNYYGVYLLPGSRKSFTRNDSLTGSIDIRMAEKMGLEILSTSFVAEGGGLENNGDGILMTIEETALQRNPGKSFAEIDAAYKKATGSKKIIWLKRMTLHDKRSTGLVFTNWITGGANGHIDEMARFINKNTIAIAQIDEAERNANPISKADYEILEENFEILKNAKDANGKPFNIIRFPYPNLDVHARIFPLDSNIRKDFDSPVSLEDGTILKFAPAVSYMNFMTTNGVVLIAAYWKEGMPLREKEKDEEVFRIMQEYFPDRQVIQINPYAINRGGGGIHCATQQQPLHK